MKIVIYSAYLFLLQHLSNQLIISNKASKVFLEASYGTNQFLFAFGNFMFEESHE